MATQLIHGDIIYSEGPDALSVHEDAYLLVRNGAVEGIWPQVPETWAALPVTDYGRGLVIPAFSDLHIHASQFLQRGVGMDCLLFDWLERYTFPQESNFRDPAYAAAVYDALALELLRHGTFHASLFTTIHYDASDYLFQVMERYGMYAYVGKVNMDQSAPDFLRETTENSLAETERFVGDHAGHSRVRPILTPRFAPTCSPALMEGLGKIAAHYGCGIQTHLCESREEVQAALESHPGRTCDGEIYAQAGLLEHGPSIFSHVIFPSPRDLELMRQAGSVAIHCPDATVNITAGIMPTARLSEAGLTIALGTDIGGGHYPGVYRQVARAVQVSKIKTFYEPENRRLTFPEAFYLATAAGGRCFGPVGTFAPGSRFDALVVDEVEDLGFSLSPLERLERFCYIGDDRNIVARYIDGAKLDLFDDR